LIGLEVINQQGVVLGKVVRLLDTGAHDVVVIDGARERLIPYVKGRYIVDVDLERGRMLVDWHPDD
jgi:16S rRNA processing protein RimM